MDEPKQDQSTDETPVTSLNDDVKSDPEESTPTPEETAEVKKELSAPDPVIVGVVTDVAPPPAPAVAKANNPVTLLLQWLTYAFWGWFALAMVWISAVTFAFLVLGSGSQDWSQVIAYPIAAVVVLLLVSAVVDFFYSRNEPAHKEGIATAIMIIHAVIFALCGIGALIAAVFTVISLMLGGDEKSKMVLLYTAIVSLIVYAILIVRTVLGSRIRKLSIIVTGVLALLAVVFIVLGVVGPVAQSAVTRQDRELETALPEVVNAIGDYAQENNKLPKSLSELKITTTSSDDTTKAIIEKGSIRYTPNLKPNTLSAADDDYNLYSSRDSFYYRLCVTYTAEKNSSYDYYSPQDDGDYNTSLYIYSHKKGEQCYNMMAYGKYTSIGV